MKYKLDKRRLIVPTDAVLLGDIASYDAASNKIYALN